MGKLIVLAGNDGAGKSTQVNLIKKYFEKNNLKYSHIHFPIYGQNEASKVISSYLQGDFGKIDEVNPIFIANIYAMDRFLYLPQLQKQLLENDVVLLDRYVFCNMAFQGSKYYNFTQSKILSDWIYDYEFNFLKLPYPDLTLFLNVPIETITTRLNESRNGDDREYLNGKKDIHEQDLEFQKRVKDTYESFKEYKNYKIIDVEQLTPEEIFKKYKKFIDIILNTK